MVQRVKDFLLLCWAVLIWPWQKVYNVTIFLGRPVYRPLSRIVKWVIRLGIAIVKRLLNTPLGRRVWGIAKSLCHWAINCEVGRWLRQHLITANPNIPKLVGDGIGVVGLLFLAVSLKEDWYIVPDQIIENEDGDYIVTTLKSDYEKYLKAMLAAAAFFFITVMFITRKDVFKRTRWLGNFACLVFVTTFLFSQLVIIDSELGHLAAVHISHHDNLWWYGGDITTSRGQEVYGYATDYIAKDLPFAVTAIPVPYAAQSLASLADYLSWTGMCPAFWYYFQKGWGMLGLSAIFLLISSLCVRLDTDQKGLASDVVAWTIKRAGKVMILWFFLIFIRTQLCAHYIEEARISFEKTEIKQSLAHLETVGKILPTMYWNSNLTFQRGMLEQRADMKTPAADLYTAYNLEVAGRNQAAINMYNELVEQEVDPQAQLEAYRGLMRMAIIDFNSSIYPRYEKSMARVEEKYPTLAKMLWLRFIMAVRKHDYYTAREYQRRLYASGNAQAMPNKRAYLASSHQYMQMMAFDMGKPDLAWQQNIFRMELHPNGARRDDMLEEYPFLITDIERTPTTDNTKEVEAKAAEQEGEG